MINYHDQKQPGEERVYISAHSFTLQPTIHEVSVGAKGRSLEAGSDAETTVEHCLLVCSLWLNLLFSFLFLKYNLFLFHVHWCFVCPYDCVKVTDALERELQTCELLCGCWELNLGPLEEQPMPISLAPQFAF